MPDDNISLTDVYDISYDAMVYEGKHKVKDAHHPEE
jgi:hypothetical protein